MRLRTKSLRIQDPIPGLDCAGIEIPNENRAVVLAGNLINNPKFLNTEKRLSFALGLNLNGEEVYADIEKRAETIAKRNDISISEARNLATKLDKKRSNYYGYYTSKKWGRSENYHLTLNSSLLGIEGTARVIAEMARIKLEQAEE